MDKAKLQQTLSSIMEQTQARLLSRIMLEPDKRTDTLAALDALKHVQREINIYLENME